MTIFRIYRFFCFSFFYHVGFFYLDDYLDYLYVVLEYYSDCIRAHIKLPQIILNTFGDHYVTIT